MKLSPTQIEKFDRTTTWGCPRRWWFRYVAKLPEPQAPAAAKGEAIHKQVEHYLKTGEDVLGPEARHAREYLASIRHRVHGIELPLELELEGVPFTGRVDCVLMGPPAVWDWKTSSDPVAYGKTAEKMSESTQMVLYAHWAFERILAPNVQTLQVAHGYIGTQKFGFVPVTRNIDRAFVENRLQRVRGCVREIKLAALETDVGRLPGNPAACQVGRFTCPFLSRCPAMPTDFDDLFGGPVAATAPVLPPDAPVAPTPSSVGQPSPAPSAPELSPPQATHPTTVSGPPAPAAESPKKRGRPRKVIEDKSTVPDEKLRAAQAVAEHITPAEVQAVLTPQAAAERDTFAAVQSVLVPVTRVVVTQGLTINLGGYNSGRVEVTMEAPVPEGADAAAVHKVLSSMVKDALEAEAEPHRKILAAKRGGAK